MRSRHVDGSLPWLIHWVLLSRADASLNYRPLLPLNLEEMTELSPNIPAQQTNKTHIVPKCRLLYQQGSCSGCVVKAQLSRDAAFHITAYPQTSFLMAPGPRFFHFIFFILDLSTSNHPHLGGVGAPFCLMWTECPGALKGLSGGNSCQLQ